LKRFLICYSYFYFDFKEQGTGFNKSVECNANKGLNANTFLFIFSINLLIVNDFLNFTTLRANNSSNIESIFKFVNQMFVNFA